MEINRSEEMLKYVEGYYRESKYYLAQNNAKGEELNIIHVILEDLPNQFNPQTATWGLRLWDELLEIDGGIQSVEERRAKVMMKLIALPRITPISLERLIKNIAKANVDIIRNVAAYTFQIRIREDSLECDSRLIRQIVEDYKEAHMAFYQTFYIGQLTIRERFKVKIIHRMVIPINRERTDYQLKTINRIKVMNEERVSAPVLTIKHNLWYLDGAVLLNGNRILDAYEKREVLQ